MSAPVWDGVPPNPERDGAHLLAFGTADHETILTWSAKGWWMGLVDGSVGNVAKHWRYIGPMYSPADHAAAVEAAREDERKSALAALTEPSEGKQYGQASVTYLIEGYCQVLRQAKRIRKHRRIITRLLSMRRDANARVDASVQAERAIMREAEKRIAPFYGLRMDNPPPGVDPSAWRKALQGATHAGMLLTPLPDTDALAAALAKAREEGIEGFDDPQWDGTDAAHPAWWRGDDHGCAAAVRIVTAVLDGQKPGTYGNPDLTVLCQRIADLASIPAATLASLRSGPNGEPARCVVVPREPTDEIVAAMVKAWSNPRDIYAAVIAAAQAPGHDSAEDAS